MVRRSPAPRSPSEQLIAAPVWQPAWATSARMVSARAPLRRALRLTAAAVAGPLFTTSISQVPGSPTVCGPDGARTSTATSAFGGGGGGTGTLTCA